MGELGPGGDRLGDVLVYAVVEDSLSPESPLGDSLDVLCVARTQSVSSRRSEATSRSLRSRCGSKNERELEASGRNLTTGLDYSRPPLVGA